MLLSLPNHIASGASLALKMRDQLYTYFISHFFINQYFPTFVNVKIEDNCFSLLYSEPGESTGKLKLFHLFSDINLWDRDDAGFIIAYGPGVEFTSHEWLNETINEQQIKNSYEIN